jgi:DNA-binding XRE family transcriptional regulator
VSPEGYKAERTKRGLSQAALAALVGVSRGCINYREAGHPRYPITSEAWLAICSLPAAKPKTARRAKGQNVLSMLGFFVPLHFPRNQHK